MKIVGEQNRVGDSKNNRQVLGYHFLQKKTLRRSPRLHALSSQSATAVAPFMDVFLFQITKQIKETLGFPKP